MQPLASSVVDWQRNLQKLGITMKVRLVDFALYTRRLEQYDFEMVAIVDGAFTLPQAAELVPPSAASRLPSRATATYRGVKSRAADALIEAMNRANTMQELRDAHAPLIAW
jgi:microcin C transport system substrate-binding protein